MRVDHSRRSILGTLAAAFASAPVAVAALSPPQVSARQPLKEPITPDRYIGEMLAIGWQPYTIVKALGCGRTMVVKGTFETLPSDYCPTDEQQMRRFQLQKAAGKSGADFYQRTGARLFELGMIHYE
jgi:hypothetical protein